MDNKQEDKEFVESESGVMDQMVVAPVEGAGVEECKLRDPQQAEPTLGDEDERGGESPTDGIKGGESSWNKGRLWVEILRAR